MHIPLDDEIEESEHYFLESHDGPSWSTGKLNGCLNVSTGPYIQAWLKPSHLCPMNAAACSDSGFSASLWMMVSTHNRMGTGFIYLCFLKHHGFAMMINNKDDSLRIMRISIRLDQDGGSMLEYKSSVMITLGVWNNIALSWTPAGMCCILFFHLKYLSM